MPHDDDTPPSSPLIERIAATLRRPVPLRADFDARVMAAVRAGRIEPRPSAAARTARWLREPRAVFVSPLAGLAIAAGLALVIVGAGVAVLASQRAAAHASVAAASNPVPGSRTPAAVQFVLLAPQAHTVSLAGDFNGWDAAHTPLRRAPSGLWSVDVPLAPGRYTYVFVVDGRRFVPDPSAPRAAGDDFGTPSSVVTVAARGVS